MKKLGRRQFVKRISLTSVSVLPGMQALAGFFDGRSKKLFDPALIITESFRLIDPERMLDLHLYFINTEKINAAAGAYLQRIKGSAGYKECFMIVRLPQQHISEEFFSSAKLPDQPFFAASYISGYSYLVFRIFHDAEFQQQLLTPEALLNWNKTQQFKLVVRQNLETSFFEIVSDVNAGSNNDINDEKFENHYPLGYRKSNSGLKYGKGFFPKVNSLDKDPSPITAIEAPYKIILSPQLPDQDKYRFKWSFSEPGNVNPACKGTELWMATLRTERVKTKNKNTKPQQPRLNALDDLPVEQGNHGNSDLQLMLMGSPDYIDGMRAAVSLDVCKESVRLLPDALDRNDLIELYIKYKLKARTARLSFSPLGISTDIEFKNKHYERTLPKGNSLYEWKQSISFGRDQKTEVSRVVIEACFGLKMLHIKKAKRETYKGASLMVYREFLMPLELEKDYTLFDNTDNADQYNNNNWKCNSPFKKVEFAETDAKQIMTIADMMTDTPDYVVSEAGSSDCYTNVLAFWPLTKKGFFLEWPFKVTDWHDKVHICKKKIFIYTSILSDISRPKVYSVPDKFEATVEAQVFTDTDPKWSFEEIETTIKDNLQIYKTKPDEEGGQWVKLLELSEHFTLKKIDHYTIHLEKLLNSIESKIRTAAHHIEDQVLEEWMVFKRKLLEDEVKLMRTIDGFLRHLTVYTTMTDRALIETAVTNVKQQILLAIQRGESNIQATAAAAVTNLVTEVRRALANVQAWASKEAYEQFNKVLLELEKLNTDLRIGFEQEYREFIEKLPGRLRNALKNLLVDDINNLRKFVNSIRNLESQVKSRIEFGKAAIGYAVYQVDEELEEVKRALKKQFGGEWEQEYEKIKKQYHDQINATVSALETRFMILKGNIRHAERVAKKRLFDFFNEYACFPQLHSASVFIKSVNDIVNKEIPCKIRYAREYITTQVHDHILDTKNNVSRVFVEMKADAREYLKSAMREVTKELGGIVNPDLAADFVTYLKDARNDIDAVTNQVMDRVVAVENELRASAEAIKQEVAAIGNELRQEWDRHYGAYGEVKTALEKSVKDARNTVMLMSREAKQQFEEHRDLAKLEGKEFFKGLEAKILGAIHLKDILGVGFELPKMDRDNKKIFYRFITDKLQPVNLGPFSFENFTSKGQRSSLLIYMEKPLTNAAAYKAWTSLNDFRIGIFDKRVIVEFTKLQIYSDQNTRNKVSVQISDVQFTQELAFLQALSKNIKIPGTGLSLSILPQAITIDFAYTVPGISGGAFTFDNLKFGVGVNIPLPIGSSEAQMPVTAKFAINGPDDKFVVATGIWGGKGHFVLEATPKYIRRIDAGIDFGGYLALNLGIARGEAFLMAGIRYVYFRDDIGDVGFELYATLSCGGSVTVFGFITISVVFLLCLKYEKYQGRTTLYGTASVTYSVKIGFFRKSFSLTFSRRLHGSEGGQRTGEMAYGNEHESVWGATASLGGGSGSNATYIDYEEIKKEQAYDVDEKQPTARESFTGETWFRTINTYKLFNMD